MANGYGRPPRLDEMMRGDIYAEEGGLDMAPSYTIPQPRDEVKSILDESGYSDFMLQKESAKRKKHIEKIMELTGGKAKIVGAEQFITKKGEARVGDPEKAKRWKALPEMDKMMVSQVASGQKQPQEYHAEKQQQEQKILDMLQVMTTKGLMDGTMKFPEGDITPERVGAMGGGEPGARLRQKIKTTRQIYAGGGRGGRGAAAPSERLEKLSTSLQQANNVQKTRDKLLVNDVTGERVPLSGANRKQYQQYTNEIAQYKVADLLELKNIGTNKAQEQAKRVMDIDVIEEPGGPMIIDNRLNISHNKIMRAIARAAMNPTEKKTAADIFKIVEAEMMKQHKLGPYTWEE